MRDYIGLQTHPLELVMRKIYSKAAVIQHSTEKRKKVLLKTFPEVSKNKQMRKKNYERVIQKENIPLLRKLKNNRMYVRKYIESVFKKFQVFYFPFFKGKIYQGEEKRGEKAAFYPTFFLVFLKFG